MLSTCSSPSTDNLEAPAHEGSPQAAQAHSLTGQVMHLLTSTTRRCDRPELLLQQWSTTAALHSLGKEVCVRCQDDLCWLSRCIRRPIQPSKEATAQLGCEKSAYRTGEDRQARKKEQRNIVWASRDGSCGQGSERPDRVETGKKYQDTEKR